MRHDSPSVTTTLLWCSSRSSRLTAPHRNFGRVIS
jgi:hypothetical protein